jgi:hypothetical protein
VFKAIVEGARTLKRAVTGGEPELPAGAHELGTKIAQAFVAGRFADVHALATPGLQQATRREAFVEQWRDAVKPRAPLTGFEVSNVGQIDLGFIPGLEDVPQDQFVAFLEIAFSSPLVALDDEGAFVVGIVLLESGRGIQLGAIHTR